VTARYHLLPLNSLEAGQYLDHRLAVAGALQPILSARAKKTIHQLSGGIPRLMNLISDRALLGAWSREQHTVDKRLVEAAANEVFGRNGTASRKSHNPMPLILGTACAILAVLTAAAYWSNRDTTRQTAEPETAIVKPVPAPTQPQRVAVATQPVESPAQLAPTLQAWLSDNRERTGSDSAFEALFGLWGQQYSRAGASGCSQAVDAGLRCIADRSALSGLLLLDRPAIMTLITDEGEAHQVVLMGHDAGQMRLAIPNGEIDVARSELEPLWFGEYLLLWRPPNGRVVSFRPGMRDPGIVWLRQSLTAILGQDIQPADSQLYDDALALEVRNYQRSRRLTVDGLVGQQTQMMINTDLGLASIPLLSNGSSAALSASTGEAR
ncbi:MAG: peptidoglycan-binding protein, partial [Pseudomonadota bacterium]